MVRPIIAAIKNSFIVFSLTSYFETSLISLPWFNIVTSSGSPCCIAISRIISGSRLKQTYGFMLTILKHTIFLDWKSFKCILMKLCGIKQIIWNLFFLVNGFNWLFGHIMLFGNFMKKFHDHQRCNFLVLGPFESCTWDNLKNAWKVTFVDIYLAFKHIGYRIRKIIFS